MKKLLIATFLLFLTTCAAVRAPVVDPYSHISVDTIKEACGADEFWNVGVLGMHGLVMRFNNCLNVKALLAIATDSSIHSEQIKRSSIDLLAMHYVEYLKQQKTKKEHNRIYNIKKIKEENSEGWLTYFFEISFTTIECNGNTCIQKE